MTARAHHDPWKRYAERTAQGGARPLLRKAMVYFSTASGPRLALDIGAGSGGDTAYLLDMGWTVVALDSEETAIKALRQRIIVPRIDAQIAHDSYQSFPWHYYVNQVDLANASYSLPFCPPADFQRVFTAMTQTLKAGGLFVGQFFLVPKTGWPTPYECPGARQYRCLQTTMRF